MHDTDIVEQQFVVCVRNDGYPAALEVRKIYRVLPGSEAGDHDYLRVVDESGEDYLYPRSYFMLLNLPQRVSETLFAEA